MQHLAQCPGDCQTVVGRRPATDLIEQNQTLRRGVVENARRFIHLDQECRFTQRQPVGGADAREDTIDDSDDWPFPPAQMIPPAP